MRRGRFPYYFHFIIVCVFVHINQFLAFLLSLFPTFLKILQDGKLGLQLNYMSLNTTLEVYSVTDGIWGLHFWEEKETCIYGRVTLF